MPSYDYECPKCGEVQEIVHRMSEDPVIRCTCTKKGHVCKRVILVAPMTVVPPHMQAAGDKCKYYGIDMRTGNGITENTDVSDPPGIRVKPTKGDK